MCDSDPAARERKVLELLENALELPEAERAGFVVTACGDDEALRARVIQLLPLQADLGPAPWAEWVDESIAARSSHYACGARIGSYEIVRQIATGGMGRVYEARQASPQRRVALKVLRVEFESDELAQRFRYESEVLARLRHPGIATVYEAGLHTEATATGTSDVPWIALEYVDEARPIDEFVRAEALDQDATLALFLKVLDAVHHGHQRGVIHRDLKPANILVDASGQVKLVDFGVARAIGDAQHRHEMTVHGQFVGTIYYMSPEQASGSHDEVDVRSDVYALGVVLYELVCGRPPHDLTGLSLPAAARAVAEQEPLRPASARAGIDRDLEAVLLKALAMEKARRYGTVSAFADDVSRMLERRPVSARMPSALRHLSLFSRRNPLVVGALLLAVSALLAATFVSVQFALGERDARRAAEALQEGLLDQSFALHHEFVPRLADLDGALDVRRALIAEAVDKLELLEAMAGSDERVQLRLASAYRSLGDVLGNPMGNNLGDLEGAERCYRRSLDALAGAPVDNPRARLMAVQTQVRLAQMALQSGRPDDALPYFEEFVKVAAETASDQVGPMNLRPDLANVLISMGSAYGVRREPDRALESFTAALRIRRELLAENPGDPDRAIAAAIALSKVATARWTKQDERAADDFTTALLQVAAVAEQHPEVPRYRRTLAETATLVSDVSLRNGELGPAQQALDRGLSANETLRRADPDNAYYRRQSGQLNYNQGWLFRLRGRRQRADGSDDWGASLGAGIEWLTRSRDVWHDMQERGEMLLRERGHVGRIEREIEELQRELGRK